MKDASAGYELTAVRGQIMQLTCDSCNIICRGDPKETARNYKILTNSGCVLQKENDEIIVLPAEEAEKAFEKRSPERRNLYYTDYTSGMKKEKKGEN